MNVRFFNISDEPWRIKKNVDRDSGGYLVENVRFTEKGTLNLRNTEILVNFERLVDDSLRNEIVDYHKFNYFYIPKNQRFYYVTEMSAEGGLVRISGKSDALTSFQSDILRSKQYILRQQEKYKNPYLVDNLLPITSEHNYIAKPFGDYVDDRTCGRIILETAGMGGRLI